MTIRKQYSPLHETEDVGDQQLNGSDRGRRIRRIHESFKEQQQQQPRKIRADNRYRNTTLPILVLFLGYCLSVAIITKSLESCSRSSAVFAVAQEFDTDHDGYEEEEKEENDEVYDEYLRAVLEEEQQQHMQQNPYDNAYSDEADFLAYQEQLQRQAEQEELRLRTEQEHIKKQHLLKIQHEREAAFERELQMAATEQQKKMLQQQRHKDHALVRKVCRASQRGDLYSVLGLRNWQFQIGGWCWNFLPRRNKNNDKCLVRFPTWQVFGISSQNIRRAYRARALLVHPDKNRDARAQEAFVAVEEAASVLTDDVARKDYDDSVKKARQERLVHLQHRVKLLVQVVRGVIHRTLKVMRSVLGPFTVPILIIGGILI